MARKTSYTFWDSPAKAAMTCYEGTWTDNDKYKDGGYFATPLDANMWVALRTASDFAVMKATASTDIIIGKLESEPQGEHTTSGRQGNVLLLGDFVLEVELATNSGAIVPGDKLIFTGAGGSYSEGYWSKNQVTTSFADYVGPIALASSSATGSIASGSVIPALFGFRSYA